MKIEVENIYESDKIRKTLKSYYNGIRADKSIIDDVLLKTEKHINDFFNSNVDIERRKVISFIGLKYDILLQQKISKNVIIDYYNDLKKYMGFYKDYHSKDTISMMLKKVVECIIKIELACYLGGFDLMAQEEFIMCLGYFGRDIEFYIGNEFSTTYDERSGMPAIYIVYMMAYNFFYNKTGNHYFNWEVFMSHVKEPKYEYYNYTDKDIAEESKILKYDFIWRD